jgi:hypothetical protein
MIVDLVKTTTADQLRLDGALHAAEQTASSRPIDAILCMSGVASNFYSSTLLEDISPSLLQLGANVLWANTRGHDGLFTAFTSKGPRRFGAAMEVVDDCRMDVSAWCDFLVQRGHKRICLFGHSLGAIKSLYSQAYEPHEAVTCVIAASPPRLSYSCFSNGERSMVFSDTIRTAERHVADGQPNALMEVRFPFPLVISAAGYLDKYGSKERYNIQRFASRIKTPTFFIYGDIELGNGGVAFAGVPEALANLSNEGQKFSFATVTGADHMYSGKRAALAETICEWVETNL